MNRKIAVLFCAVFLVSAQAALSQLNISGAQFFIESGAEVTVQGDLTTTADISGPGKVILNGTSNQNINTGGFTIPNLEMNNSANATLTGDTKIGTSLLFTSGKIVTGDFNLNLSDTALATGMADGKFVETSGSGQVIKELTKNVTSSEIPVGSGTTYRPAFITTSGTYSNARVGVKVLATADPNAPPSLSDYVTAYWPITRTGVTGTVTVAARYTDADLKGTKINLRGYYFNGIDWSSATEAHNIATNQVSVQIPSSGELAAMDKFDLLKTKVFLQGAYNTTIGVMSDALRTGGYLPPSDPYRVAPYNTAFTQVKDSIKETIIGNPFANSAVSTDDNIVDWVFLELRNNTISPGNTVLQTRSALIERDGDIVDVDGVSPVTFNNVASGSYTIAVRHRNHIGISTDPATNLAALDEKKSTATLLDFTTATDAKIFGTATAFKTSTDNKVMLWSGNASVGDAKVKYSGLANDAATILTQVLAYPGNTSGLYNYNNALGYFSGDVNMDGKVKYAGLTNDLSFILTNILAYPSNTFGLYNYNNFIQQLPN